MTVRVTSLSSFASAPGTLKVGQSVTFTAALNRPVVVSGIPTLITSDGGIAFYVAALSTPTSLVFRYTVAQGDSSSDLTVIGLTTNGGSITSPGTLFLENPAQYSTGDQPRDIAAADVNGDGNLDLVTANYGSNSVSVLLGVRPKLASVTGNFSFTDATDFAAGLRPSSVAVGDFNKDGKLDIVATNLLSDTVTVLQGEGTGFFKTLGAAPASAGPVSVTAADVNGDGNLDLVIAAGNKKASVIIGGGRFDFGAPKPYEVGSSPVASAVADIDGDGDVDIFVVNQTSKSVSVLLNDGQGGFANGNNYRVGPLPTDVVAADLNNDDAIDLVITNSGDDTITVLRGDGNGGFAPAIVSTGPNNPGAVAAADMDGDGTLDLVVASDEGVSVLVGKGDGNFATPYSLATGDRPSALVVADFNRDGLPDVAVTNAGSDTVSILRNNSLLTEDLWLPSIVLNGGTITGFVIDGEVATVVGRSATAGTFGVGRTIDLSLRFSEEVFVNGVPELALNTGGTATYVSGSSTNTLVFRTTVAAGQNAATLAVTGVALSGGARIVNESGNSVTLDQAPGSIPGVAVDTAGPGLVTDHATPEVGRYGTGQVVTLTLTGSEPLTVSGTPILTLNNGGTATYVSGSGTPTLQFRYTIGAGQDTPGLAVTGVTLSGGSTIQDAAGNNATLTGAAAAFTGLTIDTTAPVVVAVAANPGKGTFDVGQILTFTLTLSEAVTVQGSPVLQLNDGGTATFVGSAGATLTFTTTIAAGQNAATLAVTGLTVPAGASIRGAGTGTDAYLASAAETFDTISVNTAAPVVEDLVALPGNAILGVGAVVTLHVVMSKDVIVSGGPPTLTLSDGSVARYVSGSGTDTLVFTSVVAPGQTVPDLAVTGLNLNGAGIADAAGRTANLAGAVGNPDGTLEIDAAAVTVSAVAATTAETGPLSIGDAVTFSLTLDRAVTLTTGTGAPTLTLSDGGTATYDAAASTATKLVFHHTVAVGQNAANLTVETLALNGSTVTVPDGPLTFSPPASTPIDSGYNYGTNTTIADMDRDGIADIVVQNYGALSILLGDGDGGFYPPILYQPGFVRDGDDGQFFIASGPAVVADLNGDGILDVVTPGSNTGKINVSLGDGTGNLRTPTLIEARFGDQDYGRSADALTLADMNRDGAVDIVAATNGAVFIMDGDGSGGFAAARPFAMAGYASSLTPVDMDGDGDLDVVGTRTPRQGGVGEAFIMRGDGQGGLGAPTTVVTASSDYVVRSVVADLNGDGKLDVAALDYGKTLHVALADGSGGFTAAPRLTTGPAPTGLAAADVNGDGTIDLIVASSGTVDMNHPDFINLGDGSLQVFLGDGNGGFAAPVAFDTGTGNYQVLESVTAGDVNADGRPDLIIMNRTSASAVVLLNETIPPNVFDPGGAATAPGHATGLVVDTTAPVFLGGASSPARGVYDIGQVITLTLTGTEPLLVTGTPVLTLNNGAVATYVSGSGTTSLQFRTTVAAGQSTAALAVTGVTLPTGAAIRDAAGNAADLSGAPTSFPDLSIVTTAPTVLAVEASPASGPLGAGAVITLEVVLDKPVAVSRGVPTLTLSTGGTATYVAGSGTNTLVFTTTVAAGQATSDLAVTGIALNGATVTDRGGQAADLGGAVSNPAGTLAVSAPAQSVLAIAATPSVAGPLKAGDTVTFTATLGAAVSVSGTPILTLNDGGTATYDASASTATSLVFRHTVQAGQNTSSLAVTALTLSGASIAVPGRLAFGTAAGVPVGTTGWGPSVPTLAVNLDQDGIPDEVKVNPGAGTVSVRLFDPDNNRFFPTTDYAVGLDPGSVTRADVNGDGIGDLLVANAGSGSVSVLLGLGDALIPNGRFAPAITVAVNGTASAPRSVTVSDSNGDGRPDLLVASGTSVFLLTGDGAGGFTPDGNGAPPMGATVADVNGDGRPDAIVTLAGTNQVAVLLGTGAGSFGPATTYGIGLVPYGVTVADLNRDGRADLIVANAYSGTLSLLLGTGAGGFAAATTLPINGAFSVPRAVTVADMNGDGNADLLVGYTSSVSLLLGDGKGGFSAGGDYAAGFRTTGVAAADLNGDGRLDLIASFGGELDEDYSGDGVISPGGVSVRLADGSSGFGPAITYAAGNAPEDLAVADLNGDGTPDLVVANVLGGNVSVLLGNGFGGFNTAVNYAAGVAPTAVTTADLNGDGRLDLAVADGQRISVLLGNGAGVFGSPTRYLAGNTELVSISAADVNGDGRLDLVAASSNGNVYTLLNQSAAPGLFKATGVGALPGASTGLVVDTKPPRVAPTDVVVVGTGLGAVENAANGVVVGTVRGVDAGGLSMTYSLTDNAAGRFAINAASGQITVVQGLLLDYEQAATHTIKVTVTDDTGLRFTKALTVQVGNRTPEFVTGDASANTLVGGVGDDAFSGGGGNDALNGAGGDDRLYGGTEADRLIGGSGDDRLYGEAGIDTLQGGDGNDLLDGGAEADQLSGGSGNDRLDGGAGADLMDGGTGDDSYTVDNAGDRVIEAAEGGTDTVSAAVGFTLGAGQAIEVLRAHAGATGLTLTGNERANRILGNAGADALNGMDGADRLDGGTGADRMEGGAGDDVFYVDHAGDRAIEARGAGSDTVYAAVGFTLGAGQEIEFLRANAGATGLTLTGNEFANRIVGNAGADTLNGMAGADWLDGGTGADRMEGGTGNDEYRVDNVNDRVIEATGGGTDTIYASVSLTLRTGQEIEYLRANAGATGLTLTGNAFANRIVGNAGADTLKGMDGADRLDGGAGADLMVGGTGDDVFYVDNAGDRANEATGAGSDTVYAAVGFTLGAGQAIEFLRANAGAAGLTLTGNELANRIVGNAGADTLNGMAGADRLDGGTGADRMVGGTGDDVYYVDNAGDRAIEATGAGSDTVYAAVSFALGAGQEIEFLRAHAGATGLTLTGNAFANQIVGNAGADTLTGGTGADTFVFSAALGGGNIDQITDFSHAADTLHLSRSAFSGLSAGTLSAEAFKVIGAGAIDANDRVLYDKATGALSYDADGSGTGAAVQFAILTSRPTIDHTDLFVV
ncbi:FG-GAP-like repeat-containing protein [Methylobacterium sp. Leaf118]|uniref:FG-GAP-like repeat-containing protein n=1 Tax=Methylobacterium sp. Leaf118 TaxID=2876562 RepID=UPI001E386600|nr:FG-GAP-like repeat-containing protein [Methylobacterium sp. Leaf118]